MITVVKVPGDVSLAENSVVCGFKSNNQVLSLGQKASVTLVFNSSNVWANSQFKLTFGGVDYVFTCYNSSDDSGLQFPSPAIQDTFAQWLQKFASALNSNYYLSTLYDISVGYLKVIITAKVNGLAYGITATDISMGCLSAVSSAGVDDTARAAFKIFAQLNVNGLKYDDFRPVDSSGCAYFDFSELLKPEVGNSFKFPENVNGLLVQHPEAVKSFTVKYAEYFDDGSGPVVHKLSETGVIRVIPGGVDSMTEGRYNELGSSFYSQLCMNNKALTWHPGNKLTHAEDMQKLYFLTHTALSVIKLKIKLSYSLPSDGNIYSVVLTKAVMAANMYQIWEICCGYDRLQLAINVLALPTGAAVYSYDVFLVNQDDKLIMQPFTFVMDPKIYMNKRLFLFRNSLGCYETFRACGEQVREKDYVNMVSTSFRKWNFTTRTPDNQKYYASETGKYSLNSGWITKAEMEWVREMFLSREVYEVRNGMLYPVVITSETVAMGKDKVFNYSVIMEYVDGFTDWHHSVAESVVALGIGQIVVINPVVIHPNVQVLHGGNVLHV